MPRAAAARADRRPAAAVGLELLDGDDELVLRSGFIYVPLLFDPAIAQEARAPRRDDVLVEVDGRLFVRAIRAQSLVEAYEGLFPESYRAARNACLQRYRLPLDPGTVPIGETLQTILFEIMPRFIGRRRGLERKRLTKDELLDAIATTHEIPEPYYRDATRFLDTASLRRALDDLEQRDAQPGQPGDGPIRPAVLREWFWKALEARIIEREKGRIRDALEDRERFLEASRRHLATLLYVADRGAVEIDGFGFFRTGPADEYTVYKRTGEYVLKDFFGRLYLFPDCRVGVSTVAPLRPIVLDTYKHPFLEGHEAGQPICLRGYRPPTVFSASNVIDALQEGIAALLYGYSSRRRNGYHSLDRLRGLPAPVEVEEQGPPGHDDYPVHATRHVRPIQFDDYRIPSDHPKLAAGEVAVTNDDTP
jgi:hypothetical protein